MYTMIGLSILAASLNSVVLHKVTCRTKKDVFKFNLLCSVIWIIILFFANKGAIKFEYNSLFWGTIYGIVQVMFLIFKAKAMETGPVSLTTLIGNCSLLLSTIVSVIMWNESIRLIQIFGILLLLASAGVCTFTKSDMILTLEWKSYSAAFFIFASAVGIVFKCYSKATGGSGVSDMMIIAAIVMTAFLAVLYFISSASEKESQGYVLDKKTIFFTILCGCLSCMYNRMNIFLAGEMPGAVFYPVFNGGVVIVSGFFGAFLLKEKLKSKQIAGLIAGALAIIIIGVFQ